MGNFWYNSYINDEKAISALSEQFNYRVPDEWPCFGGFGGFNNNIVRRPYWPIYIHQLIDEDKFHRFAEDFNKLFANIRIRFVKAYKYFYKANSWDTVYIAEKDADKLNNISYRCGVLYTIEFTKQYNEEVKIAFCPIVGELLRMQSKDYPSLSKSVEEHFELHPLAEGDNIVKRLFDFSNYLGVTVSGNPFYIPANFDHFLLFDNHQTANRYFNSTAYIDFSSAHTHSPDRNYTYNFANRLVTKTNFIPPTAVMIHFSKQINTKGA